MLATCILGVFLYLGLSQIGECVPAQVVLGKESEWGSVTKGLSWSVKPLLLVLVAGAMSTQKMLQQPSSSASV